MPKNFSLEYNRVIGKANEGLQGKTEVNMRLWIDVIHFRFVSSWKKKNAAKQRKSLHDLCSTRRVKYIKKTFIKLVRPTLSVSVLH